MIVTEDVVTVSYHIFCEVFRRMLTKFMMQNVLCFACIISDNNVTYLMFSPQVLECGLNGLVTVTCPVALA